jgi:hypothetical protein
MKIQVKILWVVMPYIVAVGYQHIGGPYFLILQGELAEQLLAFQGLFS